VAAAAALLILAAWVATAIHLGGTPENAGLNAAALLVLGAIFGTAAGASAIANGVGKSADAANTRLDAIAAPPSQVAASIVSHGATVTPGQPVPVELRTPAPPVAVDVSPEPPAPPPDSVPPAT